MKDEIFLGNLQGILQQGKWTLSLQEASALISIYEEVVKRRKALTELSVESAEPIKKSKKQEANK